MSTIDARRALLEARAVIKRFGKFTAVDRVDLTVIEGTIHSIIGPNGAGKTTLFHTLTGLVPITAGSIVFDGEEISRLPCHRRVQKGIGRSFQVTSLFPNLDVRENLRLAAQGRAPWQALNGWRLVERMTVARAATDALLSRLNLVRVSTRAAGALSHGQQRRLELGMAMAANARVVLLDEPTSGMGVDDIDEMKDLIRSLKNERTVVLIEHNMRIVMDISDTITVMQQGQVLVEGKPDAIRTDVRVRQAYLGDTVN